ncbi:Fe-S-binding ATPase [Psittacicella melopsittaci]|uniref:Iron-sulfur cluster carrier protein n=1 Tax=Psittacicella melopsittaci TaxID=2028576 RepID=A0A3A1Y689_9GAMM|nr:iron-sulfur cluster carrier protein ApbC [Psittacicella melopsittaci]RIY32779.1 Fe-S-binding ATPase [Psittacicella melopsittaci]
MQDFTKIGDFIYAPWQKSLNELNAFNPQEVLFNQEGQTLALSLALPFALNDKESFLEELTQYISNTYPEVARVTINLEFKISQRKPSGKGQPYPGIKNIIAVSSGKGGVGKSSVAVNLAAALANSGVKVGLLDADLYGPSIPHMLGASETKPTSDDNKTMHPVQVGNLYANSMGFLVPETDPTIWRGPMASAMLKQLIEETNWPDLDYLVIDMPPGTSDIHITVAQDLAVTGSVIVSTPQDIALLDVLKGVNMFREMNVPVLGVVENMSMYTCPNCGYQAHIFGEEGVKEISQFLDTPLLASIPLDPKIRKDLDDGVITSMIEPTGNIGQAFAKLADQVAFNLYRDVKKHASSITISQL